ncbi:M23 family metallopeptidase [Cloacibacterium sp.]|jgi:murein DD-endopeptidase MepM/ murein hydrolase activator NlpD|uniref:M23 family metallopeptidase n=1 Tax=Cloacibacterium sp. TaxID=1913682 RepID=UPI0035B3DF12
MKFIVKLFMIFGILCSQILVFAQFNTLTRTEINPKETLSEKQDIKKENNPIKKKQEKKQNIISKLFKAPTKADLKKEIDSLKTLMLQYSLSKIEEQNLNSIKNKDSLLQRFGKRGYSIENRIERPIKKFDLINEEEFISKISMPLSNRITITSPFGWRMHPIFGTSKMHNGIDLKAHYEDVHAVMDGYVTEAGWDSGGGGNYIKIRHSDSFVTSYMHLSEIYYRVGESVKAGFIIAKSGNSGNSTGSHLHFSVTENGKYISPIRFLNDLIKANNLLAKYYEANKSSFTP